MTSFEVDACELFLGARPRFRGPEIEQEDPAQMRVRATYEPVLTIVGPASWDSISLCRGQPVSESLYECYALRCDVFTCVPSTVTTVQAISQPSWIPSNPTFSHIHKSRFILRTNYIVPLQETSRLMMFLGTFAVYCDNHTTHTHTHCDGTMKSV